MIETFDRDILYGGLLAFSGIFSGMLASLSSTTKTVIDPKHKYSYNFALSFICLMGVWSILPTIILFTLINFKLGIFALVITFVINRILSKFIGKFMLPNFLDVTLFIWSLFIFWVLSAGVMESYEIFPSTWSEDMTTWVSLLICFVFLILISIFLPDSVVNKLRKFLQYEFK